MRGCFVRLLFGDDLVDRREAVVREVGLCRKLPQPDPLVFWAMGEENLDAARAAGWDAQLLSGEPVLNLTGDAERRPEVQCGLAAYGTNVFHAKFLAVQAAIERLGYGQAVFLDLDIGLNPAIQIPADFWNRLESGQPFQAGLRTYHRRICTWRRDGQRTVCWAAAFYMRGTEICQRMMDCAREQPRWFEQWAMSKVVDDLMGGWKGAEAYRDAGYYFPFLEQRLCYPAEVPVFIAMLNKGYSPNTRNSEAWNAHVAKVLESKHGPT